MSSHYDRGWIEEISSRIYIWRCAFCLNRFLPNALFQSLSALCLYDRSLCFSVCPSFSLLVYLRPPIYYFSACFSACLPSCLPACLPATQPACLNVSQPVNQSVSQSIFLSVCQSVCTSLCRSARTSVCPCVHPSVCLPACLLAHFLPICLLCSLSACLYGHLPVCLVPASPSVHYFSILRWKSGQISKEDAKLHGSTLQFKMRRSKNAIITESIGFYQVGNLLKPVSRLSFGKMVFSEKCNLAKGLAPQMIQ
jgi:hypothetical protein